MEMLLSDIIQEKGGRVTCVDPQATVMEAVRLMKKERIGALLVMDGEDVVGMLTERDIVFRVIAEEIDPSTIKVHKVMSKGVCVIKPRNTVREAMQVVTTKRFRHLPVVSDGKLVGMISSGDLTRKIVAENEGVIDTLYDYIYGTYPG
jgi:CBS domain-containing protein